MGSIVDFANAFNNAVSPGSAVEGNVVKIIADNGTEIGDAVFKTIEGGNGTAAEVGVATQGATGSAIATGMGYLAMELPTVVAAVAPALGIVAGVGLYSLAPDFWTEVSNTLMEAGKTVGGKVLSYFDGSNLFVDTDVVNAIKDAFYQRGFFEAGEESPEISADKIISWGNGTRTISASKFNQTNRNFISMVTDYNGALCVADTLKIRIEGESELTVPMPLASVTGYTLNGIAHTYPVIDVTAVMAYLGLNVNPSYWCARFDLYDSARDWYVLQGSATATRAVEGGVVKYLVDLNEISRSSVDYPNAYNYYSNYLNNENIGSFSDTSVYMHFNAEEITNPNIQPGATLPTTQPVTITFHDWHIHIYPPELPDISTLPEVLPIKYPGIGTDPYPTQQPAQNPQPEPAAEIYPDITINFPIPQPIPVPIPIPIPIPDPDVNIETPDPTPEPPTPDPKPDPIDPNPDPTPTPPIIAPQLPSSVSSNKLFTVYNPTSGQLDSLGGYLWDSSIIASIRDIWQNPLDGIISLIQIYATPTTSGSHNIILGFLDSGVSSAVVGSQFVDLDCGSVSVPENKKNATDYAPYTSLHLYLPFVGIVELDTNECMNSSISVKYRIDVYTGTCLANVAITRSVDMPNGPILYTYSGNCSQQIPLTSGNATGVLSTLIGGLTAGLAVASGGGLGVVAGAQLLGNSLNHEMFHVSHSGNLSANAGILGQKKPYLIIGRRHCYDANNYNSYYGYPANKTLVLSNYTGFVKVKSCFMKTSATQQEHDEIMSLLKTGVII